MTRQHPNEATLALYAGSDLEAFERVLVALHVRHCASCRQQVANYKAIRADAATSRDRATDLFSDWDRLSDEMTANIRLGISMAECVGPVRSNRITRFSGFVWRPAVMATAALLLFACAFLLNIPLNVIWPGILRDQSGLVLESTTAGIEMRRDGRTVITVRHPDRKSHEVSANMNGSMSAGYVDDETGQVTIINVAGQ